ncbi:MAG: helix-turn-helix domain-containing protein [Verrucomicrobiae bacterium]|nr:helix-turn-helix domain-containing protein [Verrucomicrobiae bacterium]
MRFINPHRLFHGTWIPEWLDNRREISDGAKRLYAQLCRFAGNKGEAFPSYQTLAGRLQKSRRQIIRLIEELCRYELISITHVKDEVRGNRANIYRFLWHPWIQLKEDENYFLVKTDFGRPPSDINVTTPGDTRVTSPSVKNVTQKRVIYKERGKEEANQTFPVDQLSPPQQVLKPEKAIPKRLSKVSNDENNTDPWKSAKDAVESFKRRKLYPREWDNIISEIHKLSLCAIGEEAWALKWYSKAAKAASLGLPLPPQQRQPLNALPSQERATAALAEQPKIKKPSSNFQAEEKWLDIANLLQSQISEEAYQRWFNDIVPIKLNGDRLFLATPNRVYQSWIENNYRKEIREASEKSKIAIFYQTYENIE